MYNSFVDYNLCYMTCIYTVHYVKLIIEICNFNYDLYRVFLVVINQHHRISMVEIFAR